MKRLAVAAAVLAGTFFAGGQVQDDTPPQMPSPCRAGFTLNTISEHVPYQTCTSDPFVVFIDAEGNAIRAMDTSGRGEIPVSEVPGWE